MTTHIQRLYAKIQANRLNDKAFRERTNRELFWLKWCIIILSAEILALIAVGIYVFKG